MAKKKWISGAISKPGSLTATAKREGGYNKKTGTINVEWLKREAKKNTLTGKRARLALTLRKMN
jgi:hypothetical protein